MFVRSLIALAAFGSSARVVFFSSRRRHTRCYRDWSSDVCSSDLWNIDKRQPALTLRGHAHAVLALDFARDGRLASADQDGWVRIWDAGAPRKDLVCRGQIGRASWRERV